jgi:D-psicose/D-tagatose/L-ribulose 3-epimerase
MRPEKLERTLQRASSLGYTSIELAGEPKEYQVEETSRLLQQYGLTCWGTVTIMHSDRDLIAANKEQRAKSIEYVKSVVKLSAELGGSIVTVVPSTVGKVVPQATPEEEWEWAVEGLKEICAYAQELKIKIAIEPLNRFETYFINTALQARVLAEATGYSCCGIAFDAFHANMEEQDMFLALQQCGSRLYDVHLGDNNRQAPGNGSIDWKRFISVLRSIDYQGALANESIPPIDRTPASPYKPMGGQLDENPKDVDPKHLQFLKDHGSGVLSDKFYTSLVQKTAETILPLL